MKQTVNSYEFHRAFEQIRPDNFSYQGLNVLFDWFEQLDDDMGQESELDVIAICCEFSESTVSEIAEDYNIDLSDCVTQKVKLSDAPVSDSFREEYDAWLKDFFGMNPIDGDEVKDTVIDYLQENTCLVGQVNDLGADTTVIYQSF